MSVKVWNLRPVSVVAICGAMLTAAGFATPGKAEGQFGSLDGSRLENTVTQNLTRSIRLPEIGLDDGARLAGLGSSRDFYFPAPRSLKYSATLVLAYESATSIESRRSIEVLAGERSLMLKPLGGAHERQTLRIPIEGVAAQNGFIKISVRYGHVLPDNRCVDIRFAGDHLTILPETSLQLAFEKNAVDSVATALTLMPREVAIYLPGRDLNSREFGAALEAARSLRESGRQVRFETMPGADATAKMEPGSRFPAPTTLAFMPRMQSPFTPPAAAPETVQNWTQGSILIASSEDLETLAGNVRTPLFRPDAKPGVNSSSLSLINFGTGPAVLVSGPDPQSAARLIGSSWNAAAVKSTVSAESEIFQMREDGRFTFDRLRADLTARDVVDRAQWSVSLAAKDLPVQRRITGLRLQVAIAPDEANSNAVVTAFFNERMMESVSTATDMRAQLAFEIPEGLAGLNNSLRLVVQRQPQGGECTTLPIGFPAQLLGSSEVLTSAAAEAPRDFYETSSMFRDGVTLFVESRNAFQQRGHLAMLTEMASNLIPARAPLSIRFIDGDTAPQTAGPFVALTSRAPENAEPPVRFDQGRTIIRGPEGKTIADLGGLKNATVAQLVRAGLNQGIWIRTAANDEDLVPPARLQLDRGNVAVVDKNGVAFAFSTERDRLIEVVYPEKLSLADIANAYRPWVVGALWLAFSLLVVLSVHRFYARGRGGKTA